DRDRAIDELVLRGCQGEHHAIPREFPQPHQRLETGDAAAEDQHTQWRALHGSTVLPPPPPRPFPVWLGGQVTLTEQPFPILLDERIEVAEVGDMILRSPSAVKT